MTEKLPQLSALILAAGEARRFGQPKQLLPWGEENTMLGTVIDTAWSNPAISTVNVVLGAHFDAITKSIPDKLEKTHIIRNTSWQEGMFSSITAGLEALTSKTEAGAILVLLGDMPFITPGTINQFASAALRFLSEHPVIIATNQGKPAHPYLIWQEHIGEILSLSGESGIRPFMQSHFPRAEKIPVPLQVGRQDIDTWEAYERLKPIHTRKI